MVAFSKLFVAVAAAVAVGAAPSASHGPSTLFKQLKAVPTSWQSQGPADKDVLIKAQIGLRQSNMKGLEKKLLDISHPDSPNYGNWLSDDEIAQYTAPAAGHAEAVKAWLASAGIVEISQPSNDWIEFTLPVSKMESLLDTKYEWFKHEGMGISLPLTTKYSLPENLHAMIQTVTPTTAFYNSVGGLGQEAAPVTASLTDPKVDCHKTTTPKCINQNYNVDYTSTGSQLVASLGMLNQSASHKDFATFATKFQPGMKDFIDVSSNGGKNYNSAGVEGNIDTQHLGGISHPNPSEYVAFGPTEDNLQGFEDAFSNIATWLATSPNPPSSVSLSYAAEEHYFDGDYLDRVCNEFMKAGSRGVSVFVSAGDDGVGGFGGSCKDGFLTLWPASCPWITSVGGSMFQGDKEVVADFEPINSNMKSGGGGYSVHFPAPAYNKDVTAAFAASLDESYAGKFNSSNRGYPDISLVSVYYQTVLNGAVKSALGTSASAPAVAALVGVLNDYRKTQGQKPLGFLNTLLYSKQAAGAIRDIVDGNNHGCDEDGFYAAEGWDAASGLGSFDFGKLRAAM